MSRVFLTNLDVTRARLTGVAPDAAAGIPTSNRLQGALFFQTQNVAGGSGTLYVNTSSNVNSPNFVPVGGGGGGTAGVSSINGLTSTVTIAASAGHTTVNTSGQNIIIDLDPSVVFTASSQTLTNKTIAAGSNTITGLTNTNLSGTAGITNANLAFSSITIGSTAVSLGGTAATVAGLTLTSPVISTISNTGTLTLPTSTDTLVGRATADTLTNKTIAAGSNTITGLTNTNLSGTAGITNANLQFSSITLGSTAVSLGSTVSSITIGNITGLTSPSVNSDAANKLYVDTVAQGLNPHDAVNYATTANLNATYTNGTADQSAGLGIGASLTFNTAGVLVIDSASPLVGDRILVKNQTTALQNGLYVVTASGAAGASATLTRSVDGNNSVAGEMAAGDFIYVLGGSVNATTAWVNTSSATTAGVGKTIKIGTDSVSFGQIGGPGTYTAGNGISIAANVISANVLSTGGLQAQPTGLSILRPTNSGLITDATGTYIGTGTGLALSTSSLVYATGTIAQSATGVTNPANYAYGVQKVTATITGDSTTASFVINHGIANTNVISQIIQTSAGPDTQFQEIYADVTRSSGSVTVAFATAPATGTTYNVVIVG